MKLRKIPATKIAQPFEIGRILIKDGGAVEFSIMRSKKRRRTIAFRLDGKAGLLVMAPMRVSLAEIHQLLQRRLPWIRQKLGEQQRAHLSGKDAIDDGSVVPYLGHNCRVVVTQALEKPRSCSLGRRQFTINIPEIDLTCDDRQHEIALALKLWHKKRARVLFRRRMEIWATRLDVHYRDMLVTSPTRLWGSCNSCNVIRLNWHLMLAPLGLVDYVVAHELCHVTHKNHGLRFWGMLEKVMPDYKVRRKQLRLLGPSLQLS